jgi:hypothetical protein
MEINVTKQSLNKRNKTYNERVSVLTLKIKKFEKNLNLNVRKDCMKIFYKKKLYGYIFVIQRKQILKRN